MGEQHLTAALGLWAIGALTISPFAWSWYEPFEFIQDGAGPRFEWPVLWLALFWPIVAVAIPMLIVCLFVEDRLRHVRLPSLAAWWNADWSAPRRPHHPTPEPAMKRSLVWRPGDWLFAIHPEFTWWPKFTPWPRRGAAIWWLWFEAAYVRSTP